MEEKEKDDDEEEDEVGGCGGVRRRSSVPCWSIGKPLETPVNYNALWIDFPVKHG